MNPELSTKDTDEGRQNRIDEHIVERVLRDFAPYILSKEHIEKFSPQEFHPFGEFNGVQTDVEKGMVSFAEILSEKNLVKIDPEAIRREAFAEGEEKQRTALEAEFSDRIQEIQNNHKAEIDKLYRSTFQDIYQQFETAMKSGLERIEADISYQVSRILADFLSERLKEEAVRLFSKRIISEYSETMKPLTIEGNRELIELFQSYNEVDASQYRLEPTDNREIRVVVGTSVLSTRIAPLLEELREQIS